VAVTEDLHKPQKPVKATEKVGKPVITDHVGCHPVITSQGSPFHSTTHKEDYFQMEDLNL